VGGGGATAEWLVQTILISIKVKQEGRWGRAVRPYLRVKNLPKKIGRKNIGDQRKRNPRHLSSVKSGLKESKSIETVRKKGGGKPGALEIKNLSLDSPKKRERKFLGKKGLRLDVTTEGGSGSRRLGGCALRVFPT